MGALLRGSFDRVEILRGASLKQGVHVGTCEGAFGHVSETVEIELALQTRELGVAEIFEKDLLRENFLIVNPKRNSVLTKWSWQ